MSKEEAKRYYKEISEYLNTRYKDGLKGVLKSGRFQELIRVRSLAYPYSLYNTLLIISQKPEILEKGGLVLPRYKWKKLERDKRGSNTDMDMEAQSEEDIRCKEGENSGGVKGITGVGKE